MCPRFICDNGTEFDNQLMDDVLKHVLIYRRQATTSTIDYGDTAITNILSDILPHQCTNA